MTGLQLVAALTLLFVLWAGVVVVQWRRIDQLEQANRRLQRRSERADHDLAESYRAREAETVEWAEQLRVANAMAISLDPYATERTS